MTASLRYQGIVLILHTLIKSIPSSNKPGNKFKMTSYVQKLYQNNDNHFMSKCFDENLTIKTK